MPFHQTLEELERTEGDKLALLQVLSQDVGVIGVFSDWPATTTFFANCMELGLREDSDADVEAQSSAVGKARSLKAIGRLVNVALKVAGI